MRGMNGWQGRVGTVAFSCAVLWAAPLLAAQPSTASNAAPANALRSLRGSESAGLRPSEEPAQLTQTSAFDTDSVGPIRRSADTFSSRAGAGGPTASAASLTAVAKSSSSSTVPSASSIDDANSKGNSSIQAPSSDAAPESVASGHSPNGTAASSDAASTGARQSSTTELTTAAADAPLKPIADPNEGGVVEIEAASFKGITPGASTQSDVEAAWGAPRELQKRDGMLMQLYSVAPFDRVEVSYVENKVASIVIRLERAFPADAVAQQLQLSNVRAVLVSNELGDVLGQVYPERGVLFAFEPAETAAQPSMKVNEIILEPISAEPFVLRAETNLETHTKQSLADLEQALKLEPENARGLWLQAKLFATMGDTEQALAAATKAAELQPENPHFHVTKAQLLGQIGRVSEAIAAARRAVDTSKSRPHVGARALCLLGDLYASGAEPDYREAIRYHTEAVKAADPLTHDKHLAIRIAAKEVLVDAHLGAAHDIAWGEWKDKEPAVNRWLSQAATAAEEMIKNEHTSEEIRFRVCTRALAACVGLHGAIDPTPWATEAAATGDQLINTSRDEVRKTQLQWDLGMALYDALQAQQMRGKRDPALKFGQQAVAYLEEADKARPSPTTSYLLGRLYFRLGAIHSLKDADHRGAIVWFDKAVPLLKKEIPAEAAADLGRHGETFVSMGVSYWEAGQRDKGVELTSYGVALMEQAVQKKLLAESSLAVPYGNLAAMHRQLGAADQADRYRRMAAEVKPTKLR